MVVSPSTEAQTISKLVQLWPILASCPSFALHTGQYNHTGALEVLCGDHTIPHTPLVLSLTSFPPAKPQFTLGVSPKHPREGHAPSAVPVHHSADPTALSPQGSVISGLLPPGQCCLVQLQSGGLRRPGTTGLAVCLLCGRILPGQTACALNIADPEVASRGAIALPTWSTEADRGSARDRRCPSQAGCCPHHGLGSRAAPAPLLHPGPAPPRPWFQIST